MAGPRPSQSSRMSSGLRLGGEPGEVLGADLHDVGDGQQLVHAREDVGGIAHEQRAAVGVVADRGGGGGLGHQLAQHGGAGLHRERQRPGVQGDDGAVQRALQLVGRPLPVGRARDAEVVARHAVGAERDHRHGRLFGGHDDVGEVDVVGGEVVAEATAEHVVGDAGEHPGGHAEPGEPHGDVRRAAAGAGLEVLRHRRRYEIDQRLARDGDDALTASRCTDDPLPSSGRRPARPSRLSCRAAMPDARAAHPHDRAAPHLADGWRAAPRGSDRRCEAWTDAAWCGAGRGCGMRGRGGRSGARGAERGVAARSLPGRSGVGRRARPARRSPWSVAPHP